MIRNLCLHVLFLSFMLQAVEPGLLFDLNFDAYSIDAAFANGNEKGSGLPDKDLQLRMFPGPNGKGNSIALNRNERFYYDAQNNIDPRKGTISVWIAPLNWDFSGEQLISFINISEKNRSIRIFKTYWGPYIIGQYQWTPPGESKIFSRQVQMQIDPKQWGDGQWHHVAIAWDQDMMQLFIDGVQPPPPAKMGVPRYWNNKPAPPDYPRSTKPAPGIFPELTADARIYVGDIFNSKTAADTMRTAIDELKIYDRPLSANEIRKEYERVLPPSPPKALTPHLVTVPKGDQPSVVMLRQPMGQPTNKITASASVRHNGEMLTVNFFADYPCNEKKHTKRDANLWEDDSFELHLVSPQNERIQFIINGNGAIYDKKDNELGWSPAGANCKVELSKDSWQAVLEIPLAALGKLDGLWKADFTVAQRLGSKTNYYRWSNIIFDNSFTATGELRFLDTPDYVAPILGEGLDTGNLDLRGNAANGVAVHAEYIPAGQAAVAFPGTLDHWKATLPAGKLQLHLNAQKDGMPLYRYYTDCYIDYPLELEFNTVSKEKKILLDLNFSNAGGQFLADILPKGVDGVAELWDSSGKSISATTFTSNQVKSTVALPLPDTLNEGEHALYVSAAGFSRKIAYRVPDMTPYKLHLGKDNSVPLPWHPVKILRENCYEVLNRIFEFDGTSPLPSRIIVKGEELLTASPLFTVDGKAIEWNNFRVTKTDPDCIRFAADGKTDQGTLDFKGELWFDGMYKMDLSLAVPQAESFILMTAVHKEFGRYVLDPYLLPWENDVITSNVRGYNANEKRAAGLLWLTGFEKGLCFWNKSNANWINTPGRSSLEVRRDSKQVTLTARMIDKQVSLPRPAEYTLVLQPTPPRIPKKDHRRFNFCSYGRCQEVTHDFGIDVSRDASSPAMVRPRYPEKFDQQYPGRDIKILIYTMPGHLNTWEPDMDLWDKNDRNLPGTTHSGVYLGNRWLLWQYCTNATSAPADLWTWWIDETMKHHPKCGGLYFDVATVRNCENPAHGCGGVDMFGQKFFSSDALGLRDFFLRVYKTIHKRGGDIVLHCHVAFVPFVHSFIDSFAPGENTFAAACNNLWYAYTEEFSPDIYLSELNWRKAGVPYSMILQQGRACDLMPKLKQHRREILDNPEYAIRSLTAMSVYDLNVWGHYVHRPTIDKYWRIRRELEIDDVVDYHGYWVSDAVKSASPQVYCGWFEWKDGHPYRRVLIVSNFNRHEVKAALEIDWKKMGIDPVTQFRDLWNDKDISIEELEQLSIPGAHFLMLGIQ